MNEFFKNEIQPLVDELDKIIGEDKQVCHTCEGKTYIVDYDDEKCKDVARPCMDCEDTWATKGETLPEFDLINLK